MNPMIAAVQAVLQKEAGKETYKQLLTTGFSALPKPDKNIRGRIRKNLEMKQKLLDKEEKESHMEPRLQAGIELTLEKMAAEQVASNPLTQALNRTIQKIAEEQGVEQQAAGKQGSAPADAGYETRNKSFGKGTTDTDYDKKKGEQTGKVTNLNGKGNVTSEASCSEKKASSNAKIMRTMLSGLV